MRTYGLTVFLQVLELCREAGLIRHAHTTGFDLPDRRMISVVPQPSAVARMILARQTCFWGALRSATIASSRRRPKQFKLSA
jgi:hypothetical protein